jgi:tetratricopeptide (TPR) repeat protein
MNSKHASASTTLKEWTGNHTGAMEYYDKASAVDPHYVNALGNKGVALYELGNHTAAMEYFDKVLAINPHDVIVP